MDITDKTVEQQFTKARDLQAGWYRHGNKSDPHTNISYFQQGEPNRLLTLSSEKGFLPYFTNGIQSMANAVRIDVTEISFKDIKGQ